MNDTLLQEENTHTNKTAKMRTHTNCCAFLHSFPTHSLAYHPEREYTKNTILIAGKHNTEHHKFLNAKISHNAVQCLV